MLLDKFIEIIDTETIRVRGYIFRIIDDGVGIANNKNSEKYAYVSRNGDIRETTMESDELENAVRLFNMHKETLFGLKAESVFHDAMMNHEEPICPKCGKGRIVCPEGKIPRPHFFECTEGCGWTANIDYKIDIP